MIVEVAEIVLLVRDYDEALDFYVGCLGFEIVEDSDRAKGKRWIRIKAPKGSLWQGGCNARSLRQSN